MRLLAGTTRLHEELESRVARFKDADAAITFSSGFVANISTIASLVGKGDAVVCDRMNHASIMDGCFLSGASVLRFEHNDMIDLEARLEEASGAGNRLVVVDGVYSMEGDLCDLPSIVALCRKHDAMLMVDEAHAIGVIGETGRGLEEHFGLPADCVDIKMGTFSKAIPSVGGYVAGSHELVSFLKHEARGFIYSGALPPPAAAAANAAFTLLESDHSIVRRTHRNRDAFQRLLDERGLMVPPNPSPIFPFVCGDDAIAFQVARACQKMGVFVQAIPYPVVPKGKARLRVAISGAHTQDELVFCADALHKAAEMYQLAILSSREMGLENGESGAHARVRASRRPTQQCVAAAAVAASSTEARSA